MSDNIVIALISMIGSILAALIGAFGAIEAAKVKEKSSSTKSSGVSCGWIGLVASVMAVAGFVLSTIFATSLLKQFNRPEVYEPFSVDPGAQLATSSTPASVIQVGPYWGWRSEFGTETLMLNILSQGECISSTSIIVDGQSFNANLISDSNDPHYLNEVMSFESSTGSSCNYLINNNSPIRPSQYFSVPAATYGINLPAQKPFEWCYQSTDKTWYPCQ